MTFRRERSDPVKVLRCLCYVPSRASPVEPKHGFSTPGDRDDAVQSVRGNRERHWESEHDGSDAAHGVHAAGANDGPPRVGYWISRIR